MFYATNCKCYYVVENVIILSLCCDKIYFLKELGAAFIDGHQVKQVVRVDGGCIIQYRNDKAQTQVSVQSQTGFRQQLWLGFEKD